jgi:rhamnulokinase
VPPGTRLGTLRSALAARTGLPPLPVTAPATHDTASAIAGTPLADGFAFVSSGTWSLVGIETREPVLTAQALARNVTNEAGVAGTNRLLKNVMGLWLVDSCQRQWQAQGRAPSSAELERRLLGAPLAAAQLDPDDPRFLNPPDMLAAIAAASAERGQPPVDDPVELTHVLLSALARRYAEVAGWLAELVGRPIAGLHVVGGGSQNSVLNQLTADATGLPVRAGPVEATALGNVLVQAIADGAFADLAAARATVRPYVLREFRPRVP